MCIRDSLEERLFVVLEQFSHLLGDYITLSSDKKEEVLQELIESLEPHLDKLAEEFKKHKTEITIEDFESTLSSLNIQLEPRARALCVYLMHAEHKDLNKLVYTPLIELLQACSAYHGDFSPDEPERNEYKEDFERDESQSRGSSKEAKKSAADEDKQAEVELNEQQFIEIAQIAFEAIAHYLTENGHDIRSFFGSSIAQNNVEGKQTDVVDTDIFLEKLQEMRIEGLNELHQACIVKVLTVSDNDSLINIEDLAQILKGYEAADNVYEESLVDYEKLDEVSMVVLLALTEYLVKENIPLYDLFDDYICAVAVTDTEGMTKTLEVIEVKGFLKVMQEIGIKVEDGWYGNLQELLAADNHKDKINLDKLKDCIKKFATDEQLREKAHKHYMKLQSEIKSQS
eukprot:TRINITY_DN14442_c0_g1_i1.p1 TRINITY_DN14442_c0_g1~~TRINITY_DN14442_c0_g1_i1.p1  ORF type:complete len:415 (+),score=115.81 TRINITY_DN14442_c0_g1_i1:48-1247(+)